MNTKYIYNKDLTSNERVIMTHLLLQAYKNNEKQDTIQIGIHSIVSVLGIGEASVKRAFKSLVEKGYLERKRPGLGNPNIYTILK